jgi:hypothetical protein
MIVRDANSSGRLESEISFPPPVFCFFDSISNLRDAKPLNLSRREAEERAGTLKEEKKKLIEGHAWVSVGMPDGTLLDVLVDENQNVRFPPISHSLHILYIVHLQWAKWILDRQLPSPPPPIAHSPTATREITFNLIHCP